MVIRKEYSLKETGKKVSLLSVFRLWVNSLATIMALNHLILPFESRLVLKTHLHLIAVDLRANSTRSQTLFTKMDFNSSFMTLFNLFESSLILVACENVTESSLTPISKSDSSR